MGQAPTKPGPPGTKFRVIGAGMSRTGTKTLNEALTILLSGPVHDSGVHSTGGTRKQIGQWLEVMDLAPRKDQSLADTKRLDATLASLLDGYVATMDCPAALLTPELMRLFPDAVVIATTRDSESWWRSMQYVQTMTSNWHMPILLMWVPGVNRYGIWLMKFKWMALWRYGVDMFDEGTLQAHEDHLRDVVPPEKLFWYEVKQGWEPLCKILDLPVPDRPFPHNGIRTVATGAALLDPEVTRRLVGRYAARIRPAEDTPHDVPLTPRELEVLLLIANGLSNSEIATTLVISPETVKTFVSRILAKLQLRDRVQAVVYAYRHGLVT